jgi:formamidopyrimidine-DNA glycosylase
MPELPEVETIKRQLERAIIGKKIVGVEVRFKKPLKATESEFRRAVLGAEIVSVGRRAKLLLMNLSGDYTIVFHLKMSGRIFIVKNNVSPTKHTHLVLDLSGGEKLFFEDYRKFGYIKLIKTADLERLFEEENYGGEPLDPKFKFEVFSACLTKSPRKKIKPLLMEQTCVAGLGNIYAAESCFYAGILPIRSAGSLTDAEIKKLFLSIKKVLKKAIKYRGTSADAYLDTRGERGEFQKYLMVYGRGGERCKKCGATIKTVRLGGRGTNFCPKCQV